MQFERAHPSMLNVPAVYVAYFSTFGALVSFFVYHDIHISSYLSLTRLGIYYCSTNLFKTYMVPF
jgi:hypothetical protein